VNKLRGTLKHLRREGSWFRRSPQIHDGRHRRCSPVASASPKTSASSSKRRPGRPRRAKSIVVDKENTTIVEGYERGSEIQGRDESNRRQIEETTSDYDRENCRERRGKAVAWL